MLFFKKKKRTGIPAHLDEALIKRMDGKELAYVTERVTEDGTVTEKVLGKIGRINTHDGAISISCDGTPPLFLRLRKRRVRRINEPCRCDRQRHGSIHATISHFSCVLSILSQISKIKTHPNVVKVGFVNLA